VSRKRLLFGVVLVFAAALALRAVVAEEDPEVSWQ
jgi:hypothetical protein